MTTPHLHRRAGRLVAAVLCSLAGLCSAAAAGGPPTEWTVVLLNPGSATHSLGFGGAGGKQAGVAQFNEAYTYHAVRWDGTAASAVFLEPAGSTESAAVALAGDRLYGWATFDSGSRAGYWATAGGAESWVELHPPGAAQSLIVAADGAVQGGSARVGSPAAWHAAMWHGTSGSWVDLHPPSPPAPATAISSSISAVDEAAGLQVGNLGNSPDSGRAGVWRGTAASWVTLNMPGQVGTWATCAAGGRQGGYYVMDEDPFDDRTDHRACIWSGTAQSRVELHPTGAITSEVEGMNGTYQVGEYLPSGPTGWGLTRACIWSGSAASMVDLSAFLAPEQSTPRSSASAVWTAGGRTYVLGYAYASSPPEFDPFHFQAVMWVSSFSPCGPADLGNQGGIAGADGALDNNDFIAFIDLFFASDARADLGRQGGVAGADGAFDNNDFVMFINYFFAGCQ